MSTAVVAITGGIASGKSAACAVFESLGRAVIDADLVSRELVAPGQPALDEIVLRFGASILGSDGTLDRRALRLRVFSDAAARTDLESILHPRIRALLRERSQAATGPYALIAVPLLHESGDYGWVRRVLLVDVPEAVQLARVMRRDNVDLKHAEAILAAQAGRRKRWQIASDVIINDGSLADLERSVHALDQRWISDFSCP